MSRHRWSVQGRSERNLRWAGWIWTFTWVALVFLGGALFGSGVAVAILVLGVVGTAALDRVRRRREDRDRQAKVAAEVQARRDTGSVGGAQPSAVASIHDHLVRHMPGPGEALDEGGLRLPDDDPPDGERIRWAPGALDGVAVYHTFRDAEPAVVDPIAALVMAAARAHAGPPDVQPLEDALTEARALPLVDPLLEQLRARVGTVGEPSVRELYELGYALATRSGRREPVKVGIAILGSVSRPEDLAVLTTLGRHDEFSLYAAVAIARCVADPEPVLFELARGLRGWGRIHVVSRLMFTEDPVIADWILRDGFHNDVMDEYLALIAARTGRMADRLAEEPDEALVDSAGDIVVALIDGGPVPGIHDYVDAPRALDLLLSAIETGALAPARLVATDVIDRFLGDDGPRVENPAWDGWDRAALRSRCVAIRERAGWRERIEADLGSPDPRVAGVARQAARILGMDTFDVVLQRVRTEPLGHDWYELLELADETRIDAVVELAVGLLPLDAIATGPGREVGLGAGWEAHRALDAVLQGLRRFPGHGWVPIRAGLASPVIRNRNLALHALGGWLRPAWPAEAQGVLEQAASVEPDDGVRAAIVRLLSGGPPAWPEA